MRNRRIIACVTASNRDLKAWSTQGRFRADLYYCLSVFTIHLPALRERDSDLQLLVQLYLQSVLKQALLGYVNTSQSPFTFQPTAAKFPLEKSASMTVWARQVVLRPVQAAGRHLGRRPGFLLVRTPGFIAGSEGTLRVPGAPTTNCRFPTEGPDRAQRRSGRPRSRWLMRLGRHDQLVAYRKPKQRPEWMTDDAYG